jgi:hypothetical protein
VPIVLEYGSLTLLEPSGPAQACDGIALPLPFVCAIKSFFKENMSCRLYVSHNVHTSAASSPCALRRSVTLVSLCGIQFIGHFLPYLCHPPLFNAFFSSLSPSKFMLYLIIYYLLTPWCRVLLEKLTALQLVKKFPVFHGTRMFITGLTSVRQLPQYWASPAQSNPYTHIPPPGDPS